MAPRTGSAKQSKGGSKRAGGSAGRVTPKPTGRYTPPIPREDKVSPRWVPALMFAQLLIGLFMVILNYVSLLPASPTNWYLGGGLLLIFGGFLTATRYR